MVIKVYVSKTSGNQKIRKEQDQILWILKSHKFEVEEMDISDPAREEDKNYMREHAQAKEGQRAPLPPQIFNDDQYCGDFEKFDGAIEMDTLKEFLKLAASENAASSSEGAMNGDEEN